MQLLYLAKDFVKMIHWFRQLTEEKRLKYLFHFLISLWKAEIE